MYIKASLLWKFHLKKNEKIKCHEFNRWGNETEVELISQTVCVNSLSLTFRLSTLPNRSLIHSNKDVQKDFKNSNITTSCYGQILMFIESVPFSRSWRKYEIGRNKIYGEMTVFLLFRLILKKWNRWNKFRKIVGWYLKCR